MDLNRLLAPKTVRNYQNYLKSAGTPPATIDRKLASLRKWQEFVQKNYLKKISSQIDKSRSDDIIFPARVVKPTQNPLLNLYQRYSFSRIGSYLNLAILVVFAAAMAVFGYNQIFKQAQIGQAYPQAPSPTTPNRILSFQARLTDSSDTPITVPTDMRFILYNNVTASGSARLWEELRYIDPDQDGLFSVTLGTEVSIASSVFTENSDLWLGVTVETDPEATPRQRIATVGYALNAETLRGFPPSASASADQIPVLTQEGDLVLAQANPMVYSSSGTFEIRGQAMSVTTASGTNGSITIAPDGTGQLLLTGGTTSTNFLRITDANLTSGHLISGYVGNDTATGDLLNLSSGAVETEKFAVDRSGNTDIAGTLTVTGTTTANGTLDANGIVTLGDGGDAVTIDSNALILQTTGADTDITLNAVDDIILSDFITCTALETDGSGILTCGSDATGAGGSSNWQETLGSISPINSTWDVLIGATATTSAKFAVLNVNFGTPVASVSSGLSGTSSYLTADGTLATQNRMSLTIGNSSTYDTTGNVLINPNGTGNVGIGDTSPASMLTVGSGDLFQVNSSGIIAAIDGVAHTIDDVSGNLTLTSNGTSVMVADDLGVNGATSADITSTTTTATVFDTTVTTLTIGGAATALNLADSTTTKTIDLGGVTNDGTDTISIGTNGAANADVIAIGNANTATTLALTGGDDWNLAATGILTLSASAAQTTAIDITDTSYTNSLSVADNNILGTTAAINFDNFDVGTDGNITVDPAVGLDTNAAGDLEIGYTTATSVSIGSTAATTLNLGADGALTRTINIGTGTGADTINIGTGVTLADDINIGGLATSHTDFTGIVNLAGGTTYFIDATGNAKFLDLIAADTGNPGLTVGDGTIGFAKIGGSTISDNSGDLTLDSDSASVTISDDLIVSGGEVLFTPISSPTTASEGNVYYDSDSIGSSATDHLFVYGSDAAWHRIALDMTKYSTTNAAVTNQSYIQIAHNQNTNDLGITGWFYDTVTSLWKTVSDYTHTIKNALQNEWDDASETRFTIDTNGTLQQNLISYWRLDETSAGTAAVARNDSFSTNHLTDNNTVTSATGKRNDAGSFEADNDEYLSCTDASCGGTSKLDFDTNPQLSVSAWFKTSTAGTQKVIANKKDQLGTSAGYALYLASTNAVGCVVGDGTNWVSKTSAATTYADGAWHHAVCLFNLNSSADTLTLYVDGTADPGGTEDTSSVTGSLNTTDDFRIGTQGTGSGGTSDFDGQIDEVGVWRKIISSQEITDLYNSDNGSTYSSVGSFIRTQSTPTSVELKPTMGVGTGGDGAITISSDTNINTANSILGRSCADGGDAVNYSVESLTSITADLESAPSTGCLTAGDEVLLINLRGANAAYGNVGNYETLKIKNIASDVVTFTTSKTKYYGDGATDDTNIGLGTTNQAVMLQRVPNYTNVSVTTANTDFTPDEWIAPTGAANNGAGEGGVMFFRATGAVSIATSTTINANAKGFIGGASARNGGEAFCGAGGTSGADGAGGGGGPADAAGGNGFCGGGGGGGEDNGAGGSGSATAGGAGGGGGRAKATNTAGAGGGGGYGTAGTGGAGSNAGTDGGTNQSGGGGAANASAGGGGGGGGTYGDSSLVDLFFGVGGASGGANPDTDDPDSGGDGGGIVYIAANTITVSGTLNSTGNGGGTDGTGTGGGGGGGAGGSIKLIGNTLTLGSSLVTAAGGTGSAQSTTGGNGGSGRIATYYASSTSGTTSPSATSTNQPYYPYGLYHSPVIATPNSTDLESLRWEADLNTYGKIEVQTRTGGGSDTTDGTWEAWKPAVADTNIKTLNDMSTTGDWTATNLNAPADGQLARNVDQFEDEDIDTSANKSVKFGSVGAVDGYAEDTISSTDLTNYDYVTAWVYATGSGNLVKLGIGESAATEQEETVTIDAVNTWQKVYWDLSDISISARNAITKLRITLLSTNTTVYVDNFQAERLLTDNNHAQITSTPDEYLQYRIIFTTTNTAYQPMLENIYTVYNDGFKIEQVDANNVRLYNYTGATQQLRLDAVVFGADLAEWYATEDQTIAAGDVVAIGNSKDEYGVPRITKTNRYADSRVMGIISTRAGQELGIPGEDRRLVGLQGRVPTKIAPDSPAIVSGDYLAASGTYPGMATKLITPGQSVAKALEAWNPPTTLGTMVPPEKIDAFINLSYHDPFDASIAFDNVQLELISQKIYALTSLAGAYLDRFGAYSKLLVANLTAGLTRTQQLETNFISPLTDGDAITITGPVVIEPTVATDSAEVPLALEVRGNASIAGELTAGSIKSSTIDSLREKIEALASRYQDQTATESFDLDPGFDAWLSILEDNPATSSGDYLPINLLEAEAGFFSEYLGVMGQANITDLIVNNTLDVSSLTSGNGAINFLAGLVTFDSSGLVTINGDLVVNGQILAQKVVSPQGHFAELLADNIVSSGSAKFKEIITEGLIIAADASASAETASASASITTNATAGKAVLPAGATEFTIYTPHVSGDTLTYVTPTGDSQNQVLYVKSKQDGEWFKVAVNQALAYDLPFNWWTIRLE